MRIFRSFLLMTFVATVFLFFLPLLGKRLLPVSVIFLSPETMAARLLNSQNATSSPKPQSELSPELRRQANAFETASTIYWRVRFPRTLFALFAGAGLALAGMVFQAIFRNPLATPFTLGVSSGASFGATLYYLLPLHFAFFGLGGVTWFAFGGAMLAVFVVHLLSISRNASSEEMLLAGVAVSLFFSSLILLMQYVAEHNQIFRMIRWIMGGLENSSADHLYFLVPVVLVGMTLLFLHSRELNILLTGNERAMTLGVNVGRVRLVTFYLVSLLVGGIVSVCGPIGFVGLIVPHLCRLVVGPEHGKLAPASALFGGVFLALCDTIARSLIAPYEIPVGVITSLLGGPFFLWLLLRRHSGRL